jgi:hypothetical protein
MVAGPSKHASFMWCKVKQLAEKLSSIAEKIFKKMGKIWRAISGQKGGPFWGGQAVWVSSKRNRQKQKNPAALIRAAGPSKHASFMWLKGKRRQIIRASFF